MLNLKEHLQLNLFKKIDSHFEPLFVFEMPINFEWPKIT